MRCSTILTSSPPKQPYAEVRICVLEVRKPSFGSRKRANCPQAAGAEAGRQATAGPPGHVRPYPVSSRSSLCSSAYPCGESLSGAIPVPGPTPDAGADYLPGSWAPSPRTGERGPRGPGSGGPVPADRLVRQARARHRVTEVCGLVPGLPRRSNGSSSHGKRARHGGSSTGPVSSTVHTSLLA